MRGRMTPLMLAIEKRYGKPLKEILIEKYNTLGLPAMAEEMRLSKATLWYWMLRERIEVERKAVAR